MSSHRVVFKSSGRSAVVADGAFILEAARLAGEPLPAECAGRGACGRCLVQVEKGDVPEYRVLRRESGSAQVLACLTPVHSPLLLLPLEDEDLPRLISRESNVGLAPLEQWAGRPLALDPLVGPAGQDDLGVAVDLGTTTIRLLLIDLDSGLVKGEAAAYNPQIPMGADVISRIVAAEKGLLNKLASTVRSAVKKMVVRAAKEGVVDPGRISGYVVAGNLTMVHLLLAEDPAGIRRVPSEPRALDFEPRSASALGWPGSAKSRVHLLPAAGGWVGGDIIAGTMRAGFSRREGNLLLYVDLGTNGEIVLGGSRYAMACACSAGPAFEGGGIRCGMRADKGAVDGARVDAGRESLDLSVVGGGEVKGICGSGLIALTNELFRAGWIDRTGRFTSRMPESRRAGDEQTMALSEDGKVAFWERDLKSLVRAKAAVFSGIRSLVGALDAGSGVVEGLLVSGNFGRFLNLPAAVGIGLLPDMEPGRYGYIDNGSLEGAALALLSKDFLGELCDYLKKITYVDLSDLPGYMDEFVGASFIPHTDPGLLEI